MESKFSKQSKDKVIGEQEKILKQIEKQKLVERKIVKDSRCANATTCDEQWKTENQSKPNHVSHAAIEVNHIQGK